MQDIQFQWIDNPWLLLKNDLIWIFENFNLVLRFAFNITGFNFTNPMSELYIGLANGCIIPFYNILSVIVQLLLFIFSIPVGIIYVITKFLGTRAQTYLGSLPDQDNEKWFYINGVCVNNWWLEQNCKFLEKRFNRRITGIPNVSYGIFWDMIESMLQRDFNIDTISVCVASNIIINQLNDPKVTKVVLLAHSQGTIIANLTIQQIFLILNNINSNSSQIRDLMGKLEIYTFACASRYFINPGNSIRHIEHYVNELNSISLFGILRNNPFNSYSGNIFINKGKSGHLLATYYSMNKKDYVNNNGQTSRLLNIYPLPPDFPEPLNMFSPF
jgi:hypothetical protein